MNIRLTPLDVARVKLLQHHFLSMEPLGVELTHVDVVRTALRVTVAKAGYPESDVVDLALQDDVVERATG